MSPALRDFLKIVHYSSLTSQWPEFRHTQLQERLEMFLFQLAVCPVKNQESPFKEERENEIENWETPSGLCHSTLDQNANVGPQIFEDATFFLKKESFCIFSILP